MAISPNTRFGRYEIRSQLGAGGMGEVYLARDPKINRDVAIKVLPAGFSSDAERLRRFLVASGPEERMSTPTTVVLNWTADLKR